MADIVMVDVVMAWTMGAPRPALTLEVGLLSSRSSMPGVHVGFVRAKLQANDQKEPNESARGAKVSPERARRAAEVEAERLRSDLARCLNVRQVAETEAERLRLEVLRLELLIIYIVMAYLGMAAGMQVWPA